MPDCEWMVEDRIQQQPLHTVPQWTSVYQLLEAKMDLNIQPT
jgi:hypothetical protein